MRHLEKVFKAVFIFCIIALAGYIAVQGIAIAEEHELFCMTPITSAIYKKVREATEEMYLPVFSYIRHPVKEEREVLSFSAQVFPIYEYAKNQKNSTRRTESSSEYEMIVRAQAQAEEHRQPVKPKPFVKKYSKEETQMSFEELLNRYFSMDQATTIDEQRLNAGKLLAKDMRMGKKEEPQILIYHTHSQEAFVDSVPGEEATSIVGIGSYLTQILTEQYGYGVIHEKGVFDLVNGVLDRSTAYDYAEEAITKILKDNPSIEVVIDLHRDGVDGVRFVTEYKGKPAARLMFIVGMSRTADGNDITYLPNPYIEDNLAFALQLQLKAEKMMPGFMRNIYLMAYRFNLHLRPMSLLIEAGTQLNTVEEEKNAMEALAELMDEVLQGR